MISAYRDKLLIIDIIVLYTNCSRDTSFRDCALRQVYCFKSLVKMEIGTGNSSSSDCSTEPSSDNNDCCEIHQLLPLRVKSRSTLDFPLRMVNFQKKIKRKEMFCKLCPKSMNYLGNTTNMLVHLQYNHCSEYLKMKTKAAAVQPRTQFPRATSIVDR